MNIQVSGSNVVIYRNTTSKLHVVTIGVSGRAEVEVKAETASGQRHLFDEHGGAISVEVPAGHRIEVDAKTKERKVEASILSVS